MRILIAEDDPVSCRLLEATLIKWGYEVLVTCSGDAAWSALQAADAPRLAILDWMMPGMDGIEVCRRLRRDKAAPYTYVVLLTALHREEDMVAGMEAGADDYITKPFNVNELRVRLRAGKRIVELQNELIATREALREQATHDSLTGLWNREEIHRLLSQHLARIEREGGCVGIIMADLDHFKQVNDSYGHVAGDAVLREVAQRMRSLVRDYDQIGRYGGEEFILVLPGSDREGTAGFAERLRSSVGDTPFILAEGCIPVTVSLGTVTAGCGKRQDLDALIRAADRALYRAKQKGRNRVESAVAEDGSLLSGAPA